MNDNEEETLTTDRVSVSNSGDDDSTLAEIKLLASVLTDRTMANAILAGIQSRNLLSLQ
jgi:hypothetical protein